ncbi:membrane protein [Clostridium tetani]|uniref:Membrane protein n=1 Tax=Clostridium tetani TaxID=1513 RepID=A0ABC8EFU9_CLOTA|nr:TraX family protein [Clostridium tetani]BDR82380.1 membrane protein [Clostridium tetani]BDR90769.1 membrane protein [Clostridium tetani]
MNRFQIKLLMLILMLLDHIASFIPNTPIWFNYVGRVVAPVFFYLLINGYFYTKNKSNYAKRLFVASGFMATGNMLISTFFSLDIYNNKLKLYSIGILFTIILSFITYIIYKTPIESLKKLNLYGFLLALLPIVFSSLFLDMTILKNNIFLSMAFSIMFLNSLNHNKSDYAHITPAVLSLITEASILGLLMTIIFYKFRKNKPSLISYYSILSLSFLIGEGFTYESLFITNIQWMMIFSIPFFLLYNDKKGSDIKYLFYVFYPLHVWILFAIGSLLKR